MPKSNLELFLIRWRVYYLQFSREQLKLSDSRLNLTSDQQMALEADHVTHGFPVYRSMVPAYLLHHTRFVSAYSEQLRQPMWTAANVSQLDEVIFLRGGNIVDP